MIDELCLVPTSAQWLPLDDGSASIRERIGGIENVIRHSIFVGTDWMNTGIMAP